MSDSVAVSLCIPSRGRPVELERTLVRALELMDRTVPTRIVVALDADDTASADFIGDYATWRDFPDRASVFVSIDRREDTLGEKFNRCWREQPASLYVLGHDCMMLETRGWNRVLAETASAFPDDIGVVNFGALRAPFLLYQFFGVTHAMTETLGYFLPPYFPFWWVDTWINEIAIMTGRSLWADVQMEPMPNKKSRGIREVAFWATAFDALRPLRIQQALALLARMEVRYDPSWRIAKAIREIPVWAQALSQREAHLRDPRQAAAFEAALSFDAPDDARYQRVKAAMMQLMASERVIPEPVRLSPQRVGT